MALDKGNSSCSAGLSKRIKDRILEDSRCGITQPLSQQQDDAINCLCWAVAQAVVDEIQANAKTKVSATRLLAIE